MTDEPTESGTTKERPSRTDLLAQLDRERTAAADTDASLRLALAATGIGLFGYDIRVNRVSWDARTAEVFGFAPAARELDYDTYVSCVHPEDRARVTRELARYVRTGLYEDLEHRIVRPDGEVRWLLCKGSILRGPDQMPARILGGILDITDRKLVDERLRHLQKMEAVGQLTAGVAHNFNNLLATMLPNLEIAAANAPPDLAPLLSETREAALRAADMVRGLMTFTGRPRKEASGAVDLAAVVERSIGLCRRTFDRKVRMELDVGRDVPLVVADATDIEQVCLNLLINARDAVQAKRHADPTVKVKVSRLTKRSTAIMAQPEAVLCDHARVDVIDNGVGMSEETLGRAFEPFFTTKEVGHGTGLGLATSFAIVREHRGFLTASSELGVGSTFTFCLPEAPEGTPRSKPPPRPASDRPVNETILIVDDDALVRRATQRVLVAAGYQVLSAAGGEEALAIVEAKGTAGVSLVLLDLSMPGMSGAEVLAELRKTHADLPIVILSGYAASQDLGADAVLEKPAPRASLLTTIRGVLDRRG